MRRQHGCPDARAYKEAGYTGIIVTDHIFLRKYFGGPFPAVGGVGTALLSRI